MKTWVKVVWLLFGLLILVGVILWGMDNMVMCWDGIEVDEPLLMELCGITREEYFSADFNPEDCPESYQAVRMVGGCDPMWEIIIISAAGVCGGYGIISAIVYSLWRLFRRRTT